MQSVKKKLAGTYLGKLYFTNKFLFFFVSLFFFISVTANVVLRLEATPFFVWSMYSGKYPSQSEYTVYEVRYNGKLLQIPHTWEEPRKMLLFDPLQFYVEAQTGQGGKDPFGDYLTHYWGVKHPRFKGILPQLYNTPVQFRAFPDWYKRYLAQQVPDTVREITVIRKKLAFAGDGGLRELAADTVMRINNKPL